MNELKNFTEFSELLDAITRNESFRKYYSIIKSEFDSEDWEESDATHLGDINWFAVEFIRILLVDIIIYKEDPRKMMKILSDYIERRTIEAPIYMEIELNLKIELDRSEEDLDEMIKLQFKGEEKETFSYILSSNSKFYG